MLSQDDEKYADELEAERDHEEHIHLIGTLESRQGMEADKQSQRFSMDSGAAVQVQDGFLIEILAPQLNIESSEARGRVLFTLVCLFPSFRLFLGFCCYCSLFCALRKTVLLFP